LRNLRKSETNATHTFDVIVHFLMFSMYYVVIFIMLY